jgi:hypothetical protein
MTNVTIQTYDAGIVISKCACPKVAHTAHLSHLSGQKRQMRQNSQTRHADLESFYFHFTFVLTCYRTHKASIKRIMRISKATRVKRRTVFG